MSDADDVAVVSEPSDLSEPAGSVPAQMNGEDGAGEDGAGEDGAEERPYSQHEWEEWYRGGWKAKSGSSVEDGSHYSGSLRNRPGPRPRLKWRGGSCPMPP